MRTATGTWAVAVFLATACALPAPNLPLGTFQSVQPVEERLCVAIEIDRATYAQEGGSVRAWWWDQGRGDCMTRSSDVVVTGALITTDGGSHQVSLDIPLMNGDERTVRFTLEPTIGGLRGRSPDAPAGEQMEFTEVDIVDPELAP